MKKFLFTISLIIISLFVSTNVYAATGEYKLVYDIEKFNITGDIITFEGWAFINSLHNNGGNGTRIEILANDSYAAELAYNGTRNESLYQSTCMRKNGVCYESHDTASCKVGVELSSCRYDNVGFRATFSISDLIDKFGANGSITFTIKVTTGSISQSKTLAVSTEASNVKNGDKIDGTNATINISGISNKAYITTKYGSVINDTAGNKVKTSGYFWTFGGPYTIEDVASSTRSGFDNLKMYKLSCTKGSVESYACTGGSCSSAWAYATWIQVGGSVKITFSTTETAGESCPSEKNNKDDVLNCEPEGKYEQIVIEEMELDDTISSSETDHSKYYRNLKKTREDGVTCTKDLERTITTNACITQIGFANFNLENTVYSGGGFLFYADYVGNISYTLCGDQNGRESGFQYIQVKIIEKKAKDYCDDDYYKVNNTTCKKDIYSPVKDERTGQVKNVITGSLTSPRKHKCVDDTKTYYYSTFSDATESEQKIISEHMQDLLEEPVDNAKTESWDSNDINDKTYREIGNWDSNYSNSEDEDTTHWLPEEEITYELNFSLDRACINSITAKVEYTSGTCESLGDDYIDGGYLYYTPLKTPDRTSFPIKVSIADVNILEDETWSINYKCDVECRQKLYNQNGDFKFIYRPISLSNPFPSGNIPDNWEVFYDEMQTANSKAKQKMTRNNSGKEYEITLTPTTINTIKQFNNGKNYANLNTITNSGKSTYLNTLTFNTRLINYNKLGECSKDCWSVEEEW